MIHVKRRIRVAVESLEGRALLSTVNVDFGQAVRTVPTAILGVSTPGYDYFLSVDTATAKGVTPNAQTVGLIQNAGLGVLRLSNGTGADEFHFASNANQFPVGAGLLANLAAQTGSDALVNINYGTGTPQEAAAYLAYLNGSTDNAFAIGVDANGRDWGTAGSWALLRGQNPIGADPLDSLRAGHAAPYGFTRFEVGNEVYYAGWDGAPKLNNGADFAALAQKYATFVKTFAGLAANIDPNAQIGVDAANPVEYDALWNIPLLQDLKAIGYTPNFLSDHFYVYDGNNEPPISDANLLLHAVGDPSSVQPIHGNAPRNFAGRAAAYRNLLTTQLGEAGASVKLLIAEFNSDADGSTKQTTNLAHGLFLADAIGAALQTEYDGLVVWNLRNAYQDHPADARFSGWRTGSDNGMIGSGNGSAPATGPYVAYPSYFAEQLASKALQPGDTVVSASTDNANLTTYAIRRANGHLALLVINKSANATDNATFNLVGFTPNASAIEYQYGQAQDDAQRMSADGAASLSMTAPAFAITLTGSGSQFHEAFLAYSMTVIDLTPKSVDGGGGGGVVVPPVVVVPEVVDVHATKVRRKAITAIRVTFSTDLAPASAVDPSHVSLKIRRAGRRGYTKAIGVASLSYDAATHTMTITLAKPQKVAVQVRIAGIVSATGGVLAADFVAIVK